jgi:hypothetical protein
MRALRCRCGKTESMGVILEPACAGCDECGSNFAQGGSHRARAAHEFVMAPSEGDESAMDRCLFCDRTRGDIAAVVLRREIARDA